MAAPGSDLPGHRLYRDGAFSEEVRSIHNLWCDDHVGVVLGCSLSFDEVLVEAGVRQCHLEQAGGRLAVYRTSIECVPAGVFHGPLVVAMRPIRKRDVVRAVELSARYPIAHGAPVHISDPREIGMENPAKVDWGRYPAPAEDEAPVYWACGVIPQATAMASGVPEMITHSAGHMFVTDPHLSTMAH
ncbi:MAG: DUF1445 domain-containing protein [Reyranella sp.]|nr:DUF1445 domain-containing protein [Reyranella sp.]